MDRETWKHYWEIARVEIKSTNTLAQELAYGENEDYHKVLMLLIQRDTHIIEISEKVCNEVVKRGFDSLQHILNHYCFQKSLKEDDFPF